MNRDDYMNGTVDHHAFYLAVAEAIGRTALERFVLTIAGNKDRISKAIVSGDAYLNSIPLHRWDSMHFAVRDLVCSRGPAVMAISWSAKSTASGNGPRPGTVCWSMSESVCVLKSVARDMVESAIVNA